VTHHELTAQSVLDSWLELAAELRPFRIAIRPTLTLIQGGLSEPEEERRPTAACDHVFSDGA
jgi:hypothetical protein